MVRRPLLEWKKLILQQRASGLEVREFCQLYDLCAKSFSSRQSSLRKKGLLDNKDEENAFVAVTAEVSETEAPRLTNPGLSLSSGAFTLQLPGTVDSVWLAKLLKALM